MAARKPADDDFDDELDQLLEGAMSNFDKKPVVAPVTPSKTTTATTATTPSSKSEISTLAAEIASDLRTHPAIAAKFQKLLALLSVDVGEKPAPAATPSRPSVARGPSPKPDFAENMSHVYEDMLRQATGVEDDGLPGDEQLEAMLKSMMDSDSGEEVMPMMQEMMQQLFTKDVMYPSIAEMRTKYGPWIDANRAKLTAEQMHNYTSQHQLLHRICDVYENTTTTPEDQIAQALELMQQMQSFGAPPPELAPNGGMQGGFPGMPGADQCSVM